METDTAIVPREKRQALSPFLPGSFGFLLKRATPLLRGGFLALSMGGLAGILYFVVTGREFLIPFTLIAGTGTLVIWVWARRATAGLPLLPLFVVQQILIYGLPLWVGDPNLERVSEGVIGTSAIAVMLLLLFSLIGFQIGSRTGAPSKGSRWNFSFQLGDSRNNMAWKLALSLLIAGLAYQLLARTGLIWKILPGSLGRLFPIIRTFADAASVLGALTGALCLGEGGRSNRAPLFWGLIGALFLLSIADVLISGATGLVLATVIGLALGKGKVPWVFLIVAMGVVGFLNQGKFEIRAKYWNADSHATRISVRQLPSFYWEWANASAGLLFTGEKDNLRSAQRGRETGEDGQSILDRIDNLQILTYVVDAIKVREMPVLSGRTYTLIPPLLIPRFFWPGKPRTHEGQILLNLHFERQHSVKETEKTYIAWGLLPESVGNFGPIGGPVFLGLVLGWLFGFLEKFSIRKQLFSIEGLLLVAFLLKVTVSFEMVASVFVTSTFQFLVAVGFSCVVLRFLLGSGQSVGREPQFNSREKSTNL